ncbi:MAG: hypothetical protein LBT10_05935 [Methanobrevibacter sp.]|jgi:hypothetical protein|nr:hypothetical protein [Methanobrevibacter sp.]
MHSPIKDIRKRTEDLILLIITAIFLAFFVEIVAFSLEKFLNENISVLSISSIIFLFISGLMFYKFFIPNETININLKGIIAYEFINNRVNPIEIYTYSFNNDFNSALESLIAKNEKCIKIFNDEKNAEETLEKDYKYQPDVLNKKNIINSILEYLILDKLSIHLDDYYAENEIDENKIMTISKTELKDTLEKRIFLQNSAMNDIIKEEFEINLPLNSKITRNSDNYLEINNKIFDIIIIPDYQGFNEYIDPILTDYENISDPSPFYSIKIRLSIILKRAILFNNDYGWLDSFLDKIEYFISIEQLNKKLNADLLICLSKIIK